MRPLLTAPAARGIGLLGLTLALAGVADAQQASRTEPVTGIRDNGTGYHALVGARVVTGPGQVMENATIVIRDGLIQRVGRGGDAPAGARVWDMTGLTVYPGFIDAHADLGMDAVPEGGDVGPTHWNPQVRAWFSTTSNLQDDEGRRSALRSQGFGTALAVPRQGIFRGTASVVGLGEEGVRERVLRPDIAQSVGFQRSFQLGGAYPNSAMGVIALMKQTWMDTEWYNRAWDVYHTSGRAFLPPETSEALGALQAAGEGRQPVLFEANSEEDYLRAHKLATEFGLDPWFRGSGLEYRLIDVLRGRTEPLIIPLDFPDAPDVGTPAEALDASLAQLRHWYLAPTSPAQLAEAGVPFAITADGLSSLNEFLPNLRVAVARGLSADDALAALTTTPASWLGIDRTHGTIADGKVANLVVTEGDLFTEEATVRDVWVQGRVYGITRPTQIDVRGSWEIASEDEWGFDAMLVLEGTMNRLRGYLDVASTGPDLPGGARVDLVSATAVAETGRIDARFDGNALGYQGTALLSGSIRGDEFYGWASLPNGADPSFQGTARRAFRGFGGRHGGDGGPRNRPSLHPAHDGLRPVLAAGAAGRGGRAQRHRVDSRAGWSHGERGPPGRGRQGGRRGPEPGRSPGRGRDRRHGQARDAGADRPAHPLGGQLRERERVRDRPEVQMGDVVTHNNIWMYRQLAGGLTSAHIKHGSANPIGGENVIVKMRWGALPEDLKLENPPRTVKFALGENPKRRQGRYPDTRMGTQEIIRDHFMAARDYEREWQRWEENGEGIPPRRDLRMEAILDILGQELLISSHGYRADEFLALVRLAEEFGFRVQTLQHGVEAYKIASELAESDVAAVVWSDWGAFKLEAYDATVYNARILIEAGVTTSLHSDNSQIASRMNWEAGKLLRTGLTEEQALSTVTNGAAKAIAIDDRVGSLEPGKDGDFVIWNGNPLSQFTLAEQTWVDGRRYFSLEEDAVMRDQIESERNELIQAVLAAGGR